MNYRHVYMLIINHAKLEMKNGLRPINRSQYSKHWRNKGFYFEFHHILPKFLFPNWSKKHSNLVCLTAREHYFCHELLVKIYPSNQMFFAIFAFTNRPNIDLLSNLIIPFLTLIIPKIFLGVFCFTLIYLYE